MHKPNNIVKYGKDINKAENLVKMYTHANPTTQAGWLHCFTCAAAECIQL